MMRAAFLATSLAFGAIGLGLVGVGADMLLEGETGGGVLAAIVGLGTLYVAYVFARAAGRVPRDSANGGAADVPNGSRPPSSVGRAALVSFLFGLVGVFAPIGNVSVAARVVFGIVLVLGTLVGAAAVVDARNARSADAAGKLLPVSGSKRAKDP